MCVQPDFTKPLAEAFIAELKSCCADVYEEIIKLNADEPSPSICHSHDFCDANMVMADAFAKTFKQEFVIDDFHCAVWNQAWTQAKEMMLEEYETSYHIINR